MTNYELPKAVDLFTHQVTTANNLWTVFVAATFAAAGFGTSLGTDNLAGRVAITIGFWAFALGHLRLLLQALGILKSLGTAIASFVQTSFQTTLGGHEFGLPLQRLASSTNRPRSAAAVHLVIDTCVTAAVWAPYLATH